MSRRTRGSHRPRTTAVTLSRKTATPPWLSLASRVVLALVLIGVVLAAHWVTRDGLRDVVDGHISFADVLYFTMVTVTTVGYGDIVPVTTSARMLDTFLLTPIRLFLWIIFFGTAYEFFFAQMWETWRMRGIQAGLRGHTIVAGYGVSGVEAVNELLRRGTPAGQIVVVDPRPEAIALASEAGLIVAEGDATRNAVLEAVQIRNARAIIVSAGRDDTSILIVLTAARLAPQTHVSVTITSDENEVLARQAGASIVINPSALAGLLLAGSTQGVYAANYISDLASTEGRVALRERPCAPEEVARPLSAITTGLGLRIHRRGECYGPEEAPAQALEAGDVIVEVVTGSPTPA